MIYFDRFGPPAHVKFVCVAPDIIFTTLSSSGLQVLQMNAGGDTSMEARARRYVHVEWNSL